MAARQDLSQCLALAHVQARMTPWGEWRGAGVGGWCLLPALLVHGRESKGTVLGLEENSSKELFECCSRGQNGTH